MQGAGASAAGQGEHGVDAVSGADVAQARHATTSKASSQPAVRKEPEPRGPVRIKGRVSLSAA